MRTRATRGLAADFLELPATPSTARGKGKTPGKAPSQAATDSRQPLNEVLNVRVSNHEIDVCQTPVASDVNKVSDLERLLMSPTPRLTPETSRKAADVQHTAEAAAATDAAAESPKKQQVAAATAAAQSAAEGATAVQAAAAKQAAELSPASETAAEERLAVTQPLATKPAADAQAVVQTTEAAEREGAAKVAAEVQAAVDAALMAA
jgi:hypothetical protein